MKNVIILLIDALRYDCVTSDITPNLLKIANDGIFYKNCLAGNTCTQKSMPILLCGESKYFPEFSIMSRLRKIGYKSIMINSNAIITKMFSRGWDEFIDLYGVKGLGLNRKKREAMRRNIPKPIFTFIRRVYRWAKGIDTYLPYVRAQTKLDTTLDILRSNAGRKFIWVHLMDPHFPYYPTNSNMPHKDLMKLNDKIMDAVHNRYSPTDEELGVWKALYQQELREMDYAVGEFYRRLDTHDTILVITSDHGEEFGEHGDYGHQEDKFVPELRHVPLIVVGKEKGIIDEEFSHYDFIPLIFDLLGVKA